ncbi:putative ATPase [Streptosporangium becharense]|uniref:Putative ATPase n=1 Tax=Streptosporangium becharense TaxID=1816182 RepID=A0A7W9MEV6_9ACTN|nr:ATP-binding protein [Streptosporangium becharense]MBB2912990.1 putative ATPase [Streptosporangium becharense]MBB5818185.1 putative ATPase [Streptosporangium becharense]
MTPPTTSAPRRYVITGGPSTGKDSLFTCLHERGIPCSDGEIAREIYRAHRERLGRHLQVGDRREYSREVLAGFISEYSSHKHGPRFYNRGIPDGYGWDRFFGLSPYPELEEASRAYRYDRVFALDPLDNFTSADDLVWAKEREIARVHQLIIQGYYDAGYQPIFVPADDAAARVDFIIANLPVPL